MFGLFFVALCAATLAALICAARGLSLEAVAPRLYYYVSGGHNLPTAADIARVEREEWRATLRHLEHLRDRACDETRERPRRG